MGLRTLLGGDFVLKHNVLSDTPGAGGGRCDRKGRRLRVLIVDWCTQLHDFVPFPLGRGRRCFPFLWTNLREKLDGVQSLELFDSSLVPVDRK